MKGNTRSNTAGGGAGGEWWFQGCVCECVLWWWWWYRRCVAKHVSVDMNAQCTELWGPCPCGHDPRPCTCVQGPKNSPHHARNRTIWSETPTITRHGDASTLAAHRKRRVSAVCRRRAVDTTAEWHRWCFMSK